LDAALRVSTRVEIKGLQRQLGTTTVYVTHDQEEAMVLSDRIAVMRDGLLQQFDTPTQVYECPANAYIAGFIGSPAMNFIQGTIGTGEGKVHFVSGELVLGLFPDKMPLNNPDSLAEGCPVLLGVRPGALLVSREASADAVPTEVLLVEPVGEVTYAQLQLGESVLRASTDPDLALKAGSKVWASMAQHKVYLFNMDTGERL
jgi:multiple sugar transport system ATP-binding protein